MLVAVLLALAVGGIGGYVLGRRSVGTTAQPELDQSAAGVMTDALASFSSQLTALSFDPAADAKPELVAEYRLALDAYDRAAQAADRGAAAQVNAAIGEGRNALIRLDAGRRGVPIPLEAALPLSAEETPVHTADRHVYQGSGNAEILIDRPTPGKMALARYTVTSDESYGQFGVTTLIRTERQVKEERQDILLTLVEPGDSSAGRFALIPKVTHLKVEAGADCHWTVEIMPRSAIRVFDGSVRGKGPDVLAYKGRRRLVQVQLRTTNSSSVQWLGNCGCLGTCLCGAGDSLSNGKWLDAWDDAATDIWTDSDYRGDLLIRNGLLVIDTEGDWSIDTLPD